MRTPPLSKLNYKFPVKRPKRPYVPKPRTKVEEEKQIERPGIIKGRMANSLLEWWIWQGLMDLGWPENMVRYQQVLFGGQRLRGGQVIDFIVMTTPLAQPIYANGTYYHSGARRQARDIFLQRTLYERLKSSIRPPLIIWDTYLAGLTRNDMVATSAEEAKVILAREVGPY